MESADNPKAVWVLGAVSFMESSFFPLPPDILLIPMILADKTRAWRLAFICTVTSVVGGLLGYAIGYYLFASIGNWIIDFYNCSSAYETVKENFRQWGFLLICLKGLTPIPFKLLTIASGALHFNLVEFFVASLIARSLRFYLVAGILWRFGPWAREFIERYLPWVLTASLGVIILGFIMLKYIG
jgi:membrane protein YqaA with SNARE-associated domain